MKAPLFLAIFAIASLSSACSDNSPSGEAVSEVNEPTKPALDCTKAENANHPDCKIDCTKAENASHPDCKIDCAKAENANHPDCKIDCTNAENADHPDCKIDCTKAENADHPDCKIDCTKAENADHPDCKIDCTKAENASHPDCVIDCAKAENADHPDCKIDCTKAENANHPDCKIDCTKDENANHPDCKIDCTKAENADHPDCVIDCTKAENASDPACKQEPQCVHYRDFGAKGDGQTNDMQAIADAHAHANANGLPVCANAGDVYYISDIPQTAIIQTDTDWTGAEFIIDDSSIGIDLRSVHAFIVAPSQQCYNLVVGGVPQFEGASIPPLTRHASNIGITLPQESVLRIVDTNTRRYIRDGKNADKGAYQEDVLLVDTNGNVAPESPIIWDYSVVTDAFACPVDSNTLTIRGGTFTTIANQAESKENYYNRGIHITRSNVVVDGFKHLITGEGGHGAPYNGIITMNYAANITIQNSVFTGHLPYVLDGSLLNQMGSYDIQPTGVINMTLDHCTQTNDIANPLYWGVFGSNYCKNIVFKHCELSRFDAHHGVAGVRIEDSKLGHQGILVIGEGDLVIHNTTSMGTSFLTLRDDFGSTWRGNLEIRNCRWEPYLLGTLMPFIFAINAGTHNFGYECYMPTTIDIDGLYVDDGGGTLPVSILGNPTPDNKDASFEYTYPYHIPQTLRVRNYTSNSGNKWQASTNAYMFESVQVLEE